MDYLTATFLNIILVIIFLLLNTWMFFCFLGFTGSLLLHVGSSLVVASGGHSLLGVRK